MRVSSLPRHDRLASSGGLAITSRGIERLQFADQKIALDLNGNAGRMQEFIATIAPELLDNTAVRDRILTYFDDGALMLRLCQIAVDLQLMPAGDAELATLICRSVLNSPPTEADTQALVGYIEAHGQADFLATEAGPHLNVSSDCSRAERSTCELLRTWRG